MPTKPNVHKQRLKEIRRFVDFNYDLRKPLSNAAKRKIKRYHDEIKALTNRPYQIYRPRLKAHRMQAQEFAQHENRLPGLKVAFIPTDGKNKVQLIFTKAGVKGKTKHVTISDVKLSVAQLLIDPVRHVKERIAGNPAKQFTVQAGRYEIPQAYPHYSIPNAVARLVNEYSKKESNHYFGRWLHGLKAYTFQGQRDAQEYLEEKQKSIRAGKRARRRSKRRTKYKRENPST